MKKIMTILAATAALFSGFMFTGCTEEDKETLLGPTNTWCKMEVEYKKADSDTASAKLNVWVIYNPSEINTTNCTNLNSAVKPSTTAGVIPAGITFVVSGTTTSNSVISNLTNTAYLIKTFPLDGDSSWETDDSGSTSSKLTFKANRAWWTALYYLKSDLRQTANQTALPGVPAIINKDVNYTQLTWDNVKENFSWKRLLANYLLQ